MQVKYADPQALRAGARGAPPLAPSGDASVRSDSNDSILQRRSALRDPGVRPSWRVQGLGVRAWAQRAGRVPHSVA